MQRLIDQSRKRGIAARRPAFAVLFALGVASAAWAQEGNRDFYNPGTSPNDRDIFKNVHAYHLQPGIDAMARRDYIHAYSEFLFILKFYPNQPDVLNMMSELCVNRWKSPQCDIDPWFPKAIDRNPNVAKTYVVYGMHLQRQGKHDQAIAELGKALKLQPDSINANYTLGLVYLAKKDYVNANRYAQAAYALGAELPGLRDQLVRAGKWKPLDQPLAAPTAGGAAKNAPDAENAPQAAPPPPSGPPPNQPAT